MTTHVPNPTPQTGRSLEEEALYQVLSIEREAQAIIAEAEEEAERVVLAARQRAADLEHQTQQDAQAYSQAATARTLQQAQQDADQIKAQARQELAAWEQAAADHIPAAVARVVALVTLTTGTSHGTGH